MKTEAGKTEENISDINESKYGRGEHPNSLRNLRPFPKGVSGNQLGRPFKYQNFSRVLNKYGDEQVLDFYDEPKGFTVREGALKKIWEKANNGDIKFIHLLAYLGCLDR